MLDLGRLGFGIVHLPLLLAFACAAERGPGATLVPAPGSPHEIGGQPADAAVGDVDGDGDVDLVIADSAADRLVILPGDGRGGFGEPRSTALSPGSHPHLVRLGDLDGDGRLDAAVTSHDSNAVTLLRGEGHGFAPFARSPLATGFPDPAHNHGLGLVDLDGDGDLDLLFGNHDAGSVAVLLGDGHAGFSPAPGSPVPAGERPYLFAVGDLDRDGRLDLAVPQLGSHAVTLLRGDGRGGFEPFPASPLTTPERPFYTALADLDGDGDLDVIVSHDDSARLTIGLNDGAGVFREVSAAEAALGAWKLGVGDFDGDGRPDVAAGSRDGRVHVLLGRGDGTYRPGPTLDADDGSWSVGAADLDADGRADLFALGAESGTVRVWLQR